MREADFGEFFEGWELIHDWHHPAASVLTSGIQDTSTLQPPPARQHYRHSLEQPLPKRYVQSMEARASLRERIA
jgi:hypothetical protein